MINAVYKLYTALLVHRILITSRIVTASKVVHSLHPLLSNVTLLFSFEKVLLSTLSFFFLFIFIPLFKNIYRLSLYLCCLAAFFYCIDKYQWIQER